jgi:hypothetical protein
MGLDDTDPKVHEHATIVAFSRIRFPKRMAILGSSRKVAKGEAKGYLSAVVYLAPGDRSKAYGGFDVCPWRTDSCSTLCLGVTSGQLALPSGQNAEAWKTLMFRFLREWFLDILREDIVKLRNRAAKKGLIPVVRLNGSGDVAWEMVAPTLFSCFRDVVFYDYTKSRDRAEAFGRGELPENYHLTFSRGEDTAAETVRKLASMGVNTAVVFNTAPETWLGYPVIDGDETDLRFLDFHGAIVALSPKGSKAKKDETGFVVQLPVLETA